MINIVDRNSLDEAGYKYLLLQVKPQPIYTNLEFLDAITNHTNSKLYFVVSTEGGRINAALPFCIFAGVYGPVINSLPFFGSHGGIIGLKKSFSISKEIIETLLAYAKTIDCVAVTVIEPLFNREPHEIFKDFEYRDSRIGLYNIVISDGDSEDIINSFDSRARNSIKKAIRSRIKVVESHSLESIEFLARVHTENMTSAGRKAKSNGFFIEFLNRIPYDNWIILEAHLEQERVASLLLIFTSDIVEYFTPVTLTEYKQLQPMSLLIMRGLVFAKENRISYWNWGGTWMTQTGVYKFKKQWNPMETHYFYYTTVLKKSILDIDAQTLISAYPFFYVYPVKETNNP